MKRVKMLFGFFVLTVGFFFSEMGMCTAGKYLIATSLYNIKY